MEKIKYLREHLNIFAAIVVLAGIALYSIYFTGISVIDYAIGFITGVALYSLFWRWRYGFWPD